MGVFRSATPVAALCIILAMPSLIRADVTFTLAANVTSPVGFYFCTNNNPTALAYQLTGQFTVPGSFTNLAGLLQQASNLPVSPTNSPPTPISGTGTVTGTFIDCGATTSGTFNATIGFTNFTDDGSVGVFFSWPDANTSLLNLCPAGCPYNGSFDGYDYIEFYDVSATSSGLSSTVFVEGPTGSLTITPSGGGGSPITISPTQLAPATVGQPYPPVQFQVSGGTPPYNAVWSGNLPPGMQFTSGGELEGTPTAGAGQTYQLTLKVTDATGLVATDNLTLVVNAATLTISPTQLTPGTVGQAYPQVQFQASGGTPPYNWSWSDNIPGMQFTSGSGTSAGLFQGTPTTAKSYSFSVTVTDKTGLTKTVNLTWVVNGGLTLSLSISDANGQPVSRIDPTLARKTNKAEEGSITMYAGTKGVAYITVTEQRDGKPVTDTPKTTITIKPDPSRWHPDHPEEYLKENVIPTYKDLECNWVVSVPATNTCTATLLSGSVSAVLSVTATATDTNGATATSNAVSLGVWLATKEDYDPDPVLVPMGDPNLMVSTPSHKGLGNYANPIMADFLTKLESALLDLTAIPKPGASCASELLPLTLNGISLPGGGVFDIEMSGQSYLLNYLPPHHSHQAGGDVDIAIKPIKTECRGTLKDAIEMAAGQLYVAFSYVEKNHDPVSCKIQGSEANDCHWHVRLDITGDVSASSSLRTGNGPNSTAAQAQPRAQTHPPVAEEVQFNASSNLFSYSYSLTNTLPTKGSVDTFKLFFGGNVSSVQNPSGWISGMLGAKQGLMWAAASYDSSAADDVEPVLPLSALAPGATAKGFGFQSQLPPAPSQVSVSTFAPMVGFDSEDDLETAFDDLPDNTTTDATTTVAPLSSAPSSPVAMVNNMLGYVNAMLDLGWITEPSLATSLTQQLTVLRGSVSGGASQGAITDLTNFMKSVDSAKGLTTDARNVLYFDARYLIVTLEAAQASIRVNRSPLAFTYQLGGAVPDPQSLTLTSSISSSVLSYSVAVKVSKGNWLICTGLSGSTPGTISVSVNPTGLTAGTYPGSIIVTAIGGSSVTIPVTLTVNAPAVTISYTNQRVSSQAPVGCAVPPGFGSFLTTQNTIYLFFQATTTARDALSYQWMAPNGSVAESGTWGTSAGSGCYANPLTISNLPASELGSWSVQVFNNGTLLFSIPFTVSAPAVPISYTNQGVSTQPPPATGCAAPPAETSFVTTETTIYLFFQATTTPSDALTVQWIAPGGSVAQSAAWMPETGSGCYSDPFTISNLSAGQLGSWSVQVYDNGTLLFSVPFTISAPSILSATGENVTNGQDNDYEIVADTTGEISAPAPAFVVTLLAGGWGTIPGASWIAPAADQSNATRNGCCSNTSDTYQITFTVASSPSAAALNVTVAADDYVDVMLNGSYVFTHPSTAMWSTPVTFSINSGFVLGTNTLDFIVTNGGGPTGLIAAITTPPSAQARFVPGQLHLVPSH